MIRNKSMQGDKVVYGIDVSHYEPTVDWKMVAAMGKQFAFAKATDGHSTQPDSAFAKHRANSKAAGLIFGGYHFFRPLLDPVKQAETFLRVTGGVQMGELPLTVDIEWSDGLQTLGKYADQALVLLAAVEKATGLAPIIYTNPYFFDGIKAPERFAKYKLWVSAYHTNAPHTCDPWGNWAFWQYSENDPVDGAGKIDVNKFNGDIDALKAITRQL